MRSLGKIWPDPAPEAEWDLWYQDNFDYECPRQIEMSGVGLANGLTELWTRHLRETVQPDGQRGFSRFNVWWRQERRSIEIVGDWSGAVRLRTWVLGKNARIFKRYGKAKYRLLMRVAITHGYLLLAGQTSMPILEAAKTAGGRQDFEQQLVNLGHVDHIDTIEKP